MALIKCKECGNEVSTEAKTCPKCGAKLPKKKVRWGCIITAIIIAIILYKFGEEMSKNSAKSIPVSNLPQMGDEIILDDGGEGVLLATTKETLEAFEKALYAKDRIGGQEMLLTGQLFPAQAGTKALVIDSDVTFTHSWIKVRILEGDNIGIAGWGTKDVCRNAD